MREETVRVEDLRIVIDGLQQAMTRMAVAALKAHELRASITALWRDTDLTRDTSAKLYELTTKERDVYEQLWNLARGTLADTMGTLRVQEQILRTLAQGMALSEATSSQAPREFDEHQAAVEYLRTRALDDLQPEPPGVI